MGTAARTLRHLTLAALAAASGCQQLAGIGDKRVEPAAAATRAFSCTDAAPTGPSLRLAHLAAGAPALRLCASRAAGAPLVVPSGDGCATQLRFAEVSQRQPVDAGPYVLRAVDAAAGCDAAPLASLEVSVDGPLTVGLLTDGAQLQLASWPESEAPEAGYKMRFVNAASEGPLAVGLVDGLKAQAYAAMLLEDVPFAGTDGRLPDVAPPHLDEQGYVINAAGLDVWVGAGKSGGPPEAYVYSGARKARAKLISLYAASTADGLTLLRCHDDLVANGLTRCGDTADELTVETYNLALSGNGAYASADRAALAPAQLASAPPDVLCLQEVWSKAHKAAIATAVGLPYQASFDLDDATPPVDDRDLDGNAQAAPAAPPCASAEASAALDALVGCLAESCSTRPGDAQGYLSSAECPSSACPSHFLKTVQADPSNRCVACAIQELADERLADMSSRCRTVPSPVSFRGRSGLLLLSRFEITRAESVVLPSTLARSDAIFAQLTLPSGKSLDTWCAYAVPTPSLGFYHGIWASGARGQAAWEAELHLALVRLAEQITKRSGQRQAVIAGSLGAGPAISSDPAVEALHPALFDELLATASLPVPLASLPGCTLCADNPLLARAESHAPDHLLLYRPTTIDTLSLTRTHTAPVLDVPDLGPCPLSPHHGLSARFSVR